MVYYEVRLTKTEKELAKTQKEALRQLQNAFGDKKSISQSPELFGVFRRKLELYLKKLELQVHGPDGVEFTPISLTAYAKEKGSRVYDMLFDSYNPERPPTDASTQDYVRLESELDDLISDDILSFLDDDLDYLSSIIGMNRTSKICRRIGSVYYLNRGSQKLQKFSAALTLEWNSTQSIVDYNRKFLIHINQCIDLGVFKSTSDQILLYLSKVTSKRLEEPVIVSARQFLTKKLYKTLHDAIEDFAGYVVAKNMDGIIPHSVKEHVVNFAGNNSSHQKKGKVVYIDCCYCSTNLKTSDLIQHAKVCPGRNHTCGNCSETGHLDSVCDSFREKRKQVEDRRQKRRSRKSKKPNFNSGGKSNENHAVIADPIYFPHVYAVYNGNKFSSASAGIDSCASCLILTNSEYFEEIDSAHSEQLWLMNQTAQCKGKGLACFRFKGSKQVFRVPALYAPDSRLNILGLTSLQENGVKTDFDKSILTLPDNSEVEMNIQYGIYVADIEPANTSKDFVMLHIMGPDNDLWHKRLMHIGTELLSPKGIGNMDHTCEVCVQNKARVSQMNTQPELKERATEPNMLYQVDIMESQSSIKGDALLVIDDYSRYIFVEYIPDKSAATIIQSMNKIFLRMEKNPVKLYLGRQSAMTGSALTNFLAERHCLQVRTSGETRNIYWKGRKSYPVSPGNG